MCRNASLIFLCVCMHAIALPYSQTALVRVVMIPLKSASFVNTCIAGKTFYQGQTSRRMSKYEGPKTLFIILLIVFCSSYEFLHTVATKPRILAKYRFAVKRQDTHRRP
uniref:Secreted peptide n=1 Tax=Rhipicephalus pulchellus TaxID=72859 RepID=L7LXM4_RHIPC